MCVCVCLVGCTVGKSFGVSVLYFSPFPSFCDSHAKGEGGMRDRERERERQRERGWGGGRERGGGGERERERGDGGGWS